jgi:hypothetical protein
MFFVLHSLELFPRSLLFPFLLSCLLQKKGRHTLARRVISKKKKDPKPAEQSSSTLAGPM